MSALSDFRSVELAKPVKIQRDATDKYEPVTVPALMKKIVENYPNNTALMYKDEVTKDWAGITYKEYREKVEKMAKVFIKLGLERHGTVAVLAFNSVEWFVSELAAIHAGGVICGIYPTNSVESCAYILELSKANIVVVDDTKQMEKIHQLKANLPHLKAIIQTTGPYAPYVKKADGYYRWSELEAMSTDDIDEEYQRRLSTIIANECCSLIFTSGTVGKPKGVMLSHDNLTFDAYAVTCRLEFQFGKEKFVSFLPLSHVAAQISDIFLPLTLAGTVFFADKDALKGTLVQTLAKARPTLFLGVPRVFEKIQEKMVAIGAQSGALKQMIGTWAKRVTLNHHLNRMAGIQDGSVQYKIAEKLVINKVKHALGFQNCQYIISGAAPMAPETKKYFLSLGIKVLDVFGMSETSGAHCLVPENFSSFDTIGTNLWGIKTKIANPDEKGHGEMCIKGRHVFMGYLNEVEKTVEAFDEDGWMRTGDVGYIDKDENIFITGRIKELIITAGGENIPPVLIENIIKSECSAISNAILVGDKRKFLTVLLTLKTEMNNEGAPTDELAAETLMLLESLDLKYTKLSEILAAGPDQKVMKTLEDAIGRANKSAVSNAQKVQKFAILPHDFSIPTGELGPTMKLKRSDVLNMYSEMIEQFYK